MKYDVETASLSTVTSPQGLFVVSWWWWSRSLVMVVLVVSVVRLVLVVVVTVVLVVVVVLSAVAVVVVLVVVLVLSSQTWRMVFYHLRIYAEAGISCSMCCPAILMSTTTPTQNDREERAHLA